MAQVEKPGLGGTRIRKADRPKAQGTHTVREEKELAFFDKSENGRQ